MLFRKVPICKELIAVQLRPLSHEPRGTLGESSTYHSAGFHADGSFVTAVYGVKVGRRMVVDVYIDDEVQELEDPRLKICYTIRCSWTRERGPDLELISIEIGGRLMPPARYM
jgi:hypothetical protein